MKKVLGILVLVLGMMALVAFLAVTKDMAQKRAERLDRALIEAETRIMELEGDLQAAARATAQPAPQAPTQAPAADNAPTAAPGAATASGGITNLVRIEGTGNAPTVLATPTAAPGTRVLFAATAGRGITNLVGIEGTSTVHDWQVEGHLLGGTAEFGPGLPGVPGDQTAPATLDAKVGVFIPVRSLKSIEKSGRPYSDAMDEIMYGKLKAETHKRITYTLTSLVSKGSSYEAVGQLGVAGVTNTITMPVSIAPAPDGRINITGSLGVKMTDFGITPPAPSVGGLSIKTGDEIKLRFEWWVKPVQPLSAGK